MKIKPLFDKVVLVAPDEVKDKNAIIIPQNQEDKPYIAKVFAVGEGGKVDGNMVEMKLKIGDKVLYNKYSSYEFKLEDKSFILIKQSDILAIVE